MKALQEFIEMSKYAGERFDLVQAGGGNTSVKYDDHKMYIKASGYLLSEVTADKGYAVVDVTKVVSIINDPAITEIQDKKEKDAEVAIKLKESKIIDGDRPSIETILHALLHKYTLHVHAISVNIFSSHKNWIEQVKRIDPNALCVAYKTPGIELAIELKNELEIYKKTNNCLPNVIFLQNHGLIISSDNYEDIEIMTEKVVIQAENLAGIDFSKYRNTTKISKFLSENFNQNTMCYLSEDVTIYNILKDRKNLSIDKPFSPDGYVFCGYTILELDILDMEIVKNYRKKYFELPKVILYQEQLYIIAADLKKAKMIEDVFKNNLLILDALKENIAYLDDKEISYLGNWEAEKYRQNI